MSAKTSERPQPSIHPVIPAGLAILVCGVLVLLVANLSGDGDTSVATPASTSTTTTTESTTTTTTTTTIPDPVDPATVLGEPLDVEATTTYRIVYDVVENELARTETITMRRPYDALVISERDGKMLSGSATSSVGLRTYLSDREGWLIIQPELHRATYDLRPAGAIGTLVRLGFVEPVDEDDTVAGRTCRRFRTGAPAASTLPSMPSDEETTELCIDDAGLVLHERWELDGRVVTERTATSVEVDIAVDDDLFNPTPPVENQDDFESIMSTIAVLADEETLERLVTDVPSDVLDGYRFDGAIFRTGNPTQGGSTAAEIVRLYSSGPDLLEYSEQYADRPVYLGGGSATRIAVDGWDEVWIVPTLRHSVLRARLDEYTYVELRHNDPAFLLDVLASIERPDDESSEP